MHWARWEGARSLPALSWEHHPPNTSTRSAAWNLSKSCSSGIFMEPSLCWHDWLNHWPSVTDLTSSSSPLHLGGWGSSLKVANTNHCGWFPPNQLLPILSGSPKVTSLKIQVQLVERGSLWITKNSHFIFMSTELFQLSTTQDKNYSAIGTSFVIKHKSFRNCVPGTGTKARCKFLS